MTLQGHLFSAPFAVETRMIPVSLIAEPDTQACIPSVGRIGVLQGVLLKPSGNPAVPYLIVDGDRRIRSALKFGLEVVPGVVTDGTPGQIAAASAILNAARSSNPLDEARSWQIALREGQFPTIKDLAHHVHVNAATIAKRLKLLRLPESLLAHVGDRIAEGVAVALAGLPDEYLPGAVREAERKLNAGEKFTAADLKLAQTARQDDLHGSLDQLFGMVPLLDVVHDPLGELVAEVRRLAHTRQVSLETLIRALGLNGGEQQTVVTDVSLAEPALDIRHLFERLPGKEECATKHEALHDVQPEPVVSTLDESRCPQQVALAERRSPEMSDPDPLISSLFEHLPDEEVNLADAVRVPAEEGALLDDLFGFLPDLPTEGVISDAAPGVPVQATPRPLAGPMPPFSPRPGRVNLGLRP